MSRLTPALTPAEIYINTLSTVSPSSAAPACPICANPYGIASAQPVLIRPCGHIFCRSCIMAWFNSGKNICPLDRQVLFRIADPPAHYDRTESFLIMHGVHDEAQSRMLRRTAARTRRVEAAAPGSQRSDCPFPGSSQFPDQRQRRNAFSGSIEEINEISARELPVYVIFDNEILAINGCWTQRGFRHFVTDWYIRTAAMARSIERGLYNFENAPLLIPCFKDSLQMGINVPEHVWPGLVLVMRGMLRCHLQRWYVNSEGRRIDEESREGMVEFVVNRYWSHIEMFYEITASLHRAS